MDVDNEITGKDGHDMVVLRYWMGECPHDGRFDDDFALVGRKR